MEKITVAINKKSLKYNFLTKIASIGSPVLYKITTKTLSQKASLQKSYKTNIFKYWAKGFSQQYINGLQTFIINENKEKCLVYFHGGAYISNPTPQHFTFLKELAKETDFKIYFIIYPHLPYYTAKSSINLLEGWFKNIPEKSIYLGGDSSGGGLALAMYYHLTNNNIVNIEKIFTLSPWLDVSLNNNQIEKYKKLDTILSLETLQILGKHWKEDLLDNNIIHSPVYITNWGNTPLLIISGSHELLAPDISLFCNNNKNGNILWYEFDKMQHVFMLYPCKESKNANKKIVDFLLFDKKG